MFFLLFLVWETVSGRRRTGYCLFTTRKREHRETGVRVVVRDMLINTDKKTERRAPAFRRVRNPEFSVQHNRITMAMTEEYANYLN